MMSLFTCDMHEECRLLADTPVFHTENTRSRLSFYAFRAFAASIVVYGRTDGPRIFMRDACVFLSDGPAFMLEGTGYLTSLIDYVRKVNTGQAFFTDPDHLGGCLLVDWLSNDRRQVT